MIAERRPKYFGTRPREKAVLLLLKQSALRHVPVAKGEGVNGRERPEHIVRRKWVS